MSFCIRGNITLDAEGRKAPILVGVAAGQLFENYAIFSHLKQYFEEEW